MSQTAEAVIENPLARYPTATVACFDPTCGELPRRRLDEPRTRAFLERLARLGAGGLLIGSSTGQGHLRTPAELEAWFRCAAQADTNDALNIALLRPEDGVQTNERLLDALVDLDYPVVFFRPGSDLPANCGDAEVAASLQPLIAAAARRGFAIGLYSIPDVSGLPLTPEAAARLVAGEGGDHIVAVKITESDYEASTARYLADSRLGGLKIVQGWDPHLVRALRDGAPTKPSGLRRTGVTSGVMSLAVHQYLHILDRADRGDWDEARRAQKAVNSLFASMQDDRRHFADLQRAKFVMGLGHPFTGKVTTEQAERLLRALEAIDHPEDRRRLARSLDLMGDGPFHHRLGQC